MGEEVGGGQHSMKAQQQQVRLIQSWLRKVWRYLAAHDAGRRALLLPLVLSLALHPLASSSSFFFSQISFS